MKRFENAFVGVVAVVCALYLYFSLQMSMGTINRPGPGFVPTVFGIIGLVAAIFILAGNLRQARADAAAASTAKPATAADPSATVIADTAAASVGASVAIAEAAATSVGTPDLIAAAAMGADAGASTAAAGTLAGGAAPAAGPAPANADANAVDQAGMGRFWGYLIASVLFIPMLRYLGAMITVFALVLALTKVSGAKGWIRPAIFAAICSAAFYAVFELALHVSLPRGIL